MKLKFNLLAIVVFGSMFFCHAQKKFEISIIQDGNAITPGFTNEVVLSKAPFKIQVKLTKLEGVYLFAAFKDSIYKISNNETIPGFDQLPAMVMAENSFNPNQELIMNDEGWAYWFYDPKEDWHRFDKDIYIDTDKNVTGTKSVKQFYDYTAGKEFPIADVKSPLYLFFFSQTGH